MAIQQFKKAIEIMPDDSSSHYNLASCLYANGDVDGAISEYREALRADPNMAAAYVGLGNAMASKG